METTIKTYQYFFIKREIEQLLNVYHSVNDKKTVATVQALATERINEVVENDPQVIALVEPFVKQVMDTNLKKKKRQNCSNV